jgi:hypothetical protein
MDIIQLLSAAGIGGVVGSLITTMLQAWFSHRSFLASRNFQEKKEAYVGFLEALHRSEIEQTQEAAARAGHWQNRCELVAPEAVRSLIYRIFETNPEKGKPHPDRPNVVAQLKRAMRVDLGVQDR